MLTRSRCTHCVHGSGYGPFPMVTLLLRFFLFSLNFWVFPSIHIVCSARAVHYFYVLWCLIGFRPLWHCMSCCVWTTQHDNLPTFAIKVFPAISYGCGTTYNEEVKDQTHTCVTCVTCDPDLQPELHDTVRALTWLTSNSLVSCL